MSAQCIELQNGARCWDLHRLILVSEGYALCTNEEVWWAWCLGQPNQNVHFVAGIGACWWPGAIRGRDGEPIEAFVSSHFLRKDDALALIAADIEAGRRRTTGDWDEETERARLVAVPS